MDTETQNEIIAENAAVFDSMDMVTSPHGGHLVIVSVRDGMHVCQLCGEPFEAMGPKAAVEKKPPHATVPVLMHPGCPVSGRRRGFVSAALSSPRALVKAMAGANALKSAKRVLAGANHLAEIVKESAKKIVL